MLEEFMPRRVYVEALGRHDRFQSIVCGDCGKTENFRMSKSKPLPAVALVKKGQQLGWVMGHKRKHDLCPKCVAKRVTTNANVIKLETTVSHTAPTVTTLPTKAPAPREPSRDDKRIIFDKIDEHYLGETLGYEAGFTDAAIAKDLGVPEAWVRGIREDFFGPTGNEEIVAMTGELKKLDAKLSGFRQTLDTWAGVLREQTEKLEKADGQYAELSAAIGSIRARLDGIQKKVGERK